MAKLDTDEPPVGPAGWAAVLDKLLLGVTHNISNRVATLAGVSDILSGDPTIPPILRALTDEVPRLEDAIRLLRLLAAPEDEREEAVEATRLTEDAIALVSLHPECQRAEFEVVGRREVPPVVARPAALTHELVVALVAAVEAGSADGSTGEAGTVVHIPIVFTADQSDLVITAGPGAVRARLLGARPA